MIDSVVTGPEISILHVAHKVLGEDRVTVPEAIGHVDATAEALLLRTREIERRAADDGPVEVDAEHQVRGEARRDACEVVPAVGTDEVRDDVAARPVAVGELAMIERLG